MQCDTSMQWRNNGCKEKQYHSLCRGTFTIKQHMHYAGTNKGVPGGGGSRLS